jgi:hypothetical protein
MKRRQFLAFLGFFSFGGTTAFWALAETFLAGGGG